MPALPMLGSAGFIFVGMLLLAQPAAAAAAAWGNATVATSAARRALQAVTSYAMDDATIFVAVNECKAESEDFNCPISQATYGPISTWDTSAVTTFNNFGAGCVITGNRDGTGNVAEHYCGLFYRATGLTADLSSWWTDAVTSMCGLFYGATAFNGDLSLWQTGAVTNMRCMFREADAFNGDVSSFQTEAVTTMSGMFQGALAFNGDISSWQTGAVERIDAMFRNARSFNGDLSAWAPNLGSIWTMESMFFSSAMATDLREAWGVPVDCQNSYPADLCGGVVTRWMYDGSCQAGVTELCEATCASFSTTFPTTPAAYVIGDPTGTTNSGLGVKRCAVPGTNPVVTCADGVFSASGCAELNVCTRPDLTGYDTPTETNLVTNSRTPFDVSIMSCDTGWAGTPVVTACTTAGAYTLTGCAAICTTPETTSGFAIVENQVSLAVGFDVTATCQEYYGLTDEQPGVTACTEPGPYTLTGCTLNDPCGAGEDDCFDNMGDFSHTCIHTGAGTHDCRCLDSAYGSAAAAGSSLTLAGQSEACTACLAQAFCLASESFCMGVLPVRVATTLGCSPGGADDGYYVDTSHTVQQCAVGTYQLAGGVDTEGCPACTSQAGCDTDGTACLPPTGDLPLKLECLATVASQYYLVDGMATAFVCTPPADTTGYSISAESLVSSVFSVGLACATGYEGTAAAACTANDEYTLSGCTEVFCTQPASITGYTVTNTELNAARGFSVEVACAENFVSTGIGPTAFACLLSGPYTLEGCLDSSIVCTSPLDTTGYVIVNENNLGGRLLDVEVTCADDYQEVDFGVSPVATTCSVDAGPYVLSGCVPKCARGWLRHGRKPGPPRPMCTLPPR